MRSLNQPRAALTQASGLIEVPGGALSSQSHTQNTRRFVFLHLRTTIYTVCRQRACRTHVNALAHLSLPYPFPLHRSPFLSHTSTLHMVHGSAAYAHLRLAQQGGGGGGAGVDSSCFRSSGSSRSRNCQPTIGCSTSRTTRRRRSRRCCSRNRRRRRTRHSPRCNPVAAARRVRRRLRP